VVAQIVPTRPAGRTVIIFRSHGLPESALPGRPAVICETEHAAGRLLPSMFLDHDAGAPSAGPLAASLKAASVPYWEPARMTVLTCAAPHRKETVSATFFWGGSACPAAVRLRPGKPNARSTGATRPLRCKILKNGNAKQYLSHDPFYDEQLGGFFQFLGVFRANVRDPRHRRFHKTEVFAWGWAGP